MGKKVIYRPEILKGKFKQELNKEIKKEINADPQLRIQVRALSKKARNRYFKQLRDKKLGGKTIQGLLQEEEYNISGNL